MSRRRLSAPLLAFSLVLLAGCSGESTSDSPSASGASTTAPTGSESGSGPEETEPAGPDLDLGLLPAESFASGASAQPIADADFSDADVSAVADDTVVNPPECAADGGPYETATDVAAQQVTAPEGVVFVQSIQSPYQGTSRDPANAEFVFGGCSASTLEFPDGRRVEQTVTTLDVGDIGDERAGYRLDSVASAPSGETGYTSILFGDAVDGDRVVSLALFLSSAEPVSPDFAAELEAGFRELLGTAFDYQHEALA